MGLSNNSKNNNGTLVFLSPRSKNAKGEKVTPYFEIARIDSDKKIKKTDETATQVSGDLLRPVFKTTEYNGSPVKHVALMFADKDAKETYYTDLTYRIATRGVFNALLSVTDPTGLSLSIYESKSGYEAMSLWQNDKLVPWKYKKEEIPDAIVVKFKGKDQHDFTPVDDFYEAKLKEWAETLFGPEKAKTGTSAATPSSEKPVKENKTPDEKTDDDVPF